MTKRLDDAIAKVRGLSAPEQDIAADVLLSLVGGREDGIRLTADQADEVRRIQRGLADGSLGLASDKAMAAFWQKAGL